MEAYHHNGDICIFFDEGPCKETGFSWPPQSERMPEIKFSVSKNCEYKLFHKIQRKKDGEIIYVQKKKNIFDRRSIFMDAIKVEV